MAAVPDLAFRTSLLRRYGSRFGHREHLHMSWSYVRRDGLPDAADLVVAFIQHVASEHGDHAKYHETLTRFWVHAVGLAVAEHGQASFDDLLVAAPHLTDKDLPYRHWSRELLSSPGAREHWVEPDLRALPPQIPARVDL